MTEIDFDDVFLVADTVTLEQPDSAPLVRFSGADVRRRGDSLMIAVGDGSEGDVKLYAGDGRLIRVIGQKGDGPGEFQVPWYPRFGSDDLIYVADGMTPRVQWFSSDGTYLGGVLLPGIAGIGAFELLPDGSFLVLTQFSDSLIAIYDRSGRVLRRYFVRDGRIAPVVDEPGAPQWQTILMHGMARSGDTVVVTSAPSDSLWSLDLSTGGLSAHSLRFRQYVEPTAEGYDQERPGAIRRWRSSFHLATKPFAGDGWVAVQFVTGVLNLGHPRVLVLWTADQGWALVRDAPVLVFGRGNLALALLSASESTVDVSLGILEFRDRESITGMVR